MKPLLYSVLPRPPHPTRDGLAIRNYHLLAGLTEEFRVRAAALLPPHLAGSGEYPAGIEVEEVPQAGRMLRRAAALAGSALTLRAYSACSTAPAPSPRSWRAGSPGNGPRGSWRTRIMSRRPRSPPARGRRRTFTTWTRGSGRGWGRARGPCSSACSRGGRRRASRGWNAASSARPPGSPASPRPMPGLSPSAARSLPGSSPTAWTFPATGSGRSRPQRTRSSSWGTWRGHPTRKGSGGSARRSGRG